MLNDMPITWRPPESRGSDCLPFQALPHDEAERLDALRKLQILDTPPDAGFDLMVRLTARIFEVPIAYISIVDARRQWFKARHGIALTETPRAISFCSHAILQREPLIVPDLATDYRFAGSPLVTGEPWARFYAGMPLAEPGGKNVGTLCVLDTKPRAFSARQVEIFRDLGALAERELGRFACPAEDAD